MNRHEIMETVVQLVAARMKQDPAQISANHSLGDDLGADSIDHLELAMEFEEKFGLEISDEELATIKTIGDIVDLVERKQKEKN